MIGGRQQGGQRRAPRIGLVAGEIDGGGRGRDIGRDLDLQVAVPVLRAAISAGAFRVMRRMPRPLAEEASTPAAKSPSAGFRLPESKAGAFSSTIQAVRPRTNTAAGKGPAPLKVMMAPSRVRLASATGMAWRGCRGGRLRWLARLLAVLLASTGLASAVFVSGLAAACLGSAGFASAGLAAGLSASCCDGLRDHLRLGLAGAGLCRGRWRRHGRHRGDGGLGGAGRCVGRAIGLGRQNIEHDMGAVLEIVIAGIGIGLELHDGGLPPSMRQAAFFTQGGAKRAMRRNIDAHGRVELDRHFPGAGKHVIGNILAASRTPAG